MDNQRITVFGGTGFLGRTIVHHLVRSGARVRIAARRPYAPVPTGSSKQIELQTTDVRNANSIAEAVQGASGVVNAVGLYVEKGNATFDAIHVAGAEQVARQANQAGVRRLIHISGVGIDLASSSAYVRARARGEQRVRETFPEAIILRPSVLFGLNDAFLGSLQTVTGLPIVPLFGRGTVRLQPVYVEDVAQAVLRVLEASETTRRIFELGGACVYRYRDIVKCVLAHLDRHRPLLPIPFPIWRLLARAISFLPNPPLTLDQVILMETDNVVGTGVGTFQDLGIEPSSLEEKLAACLG